MSKLVDEEGLAPPASGVSDRRSYLAELLVNEVASTAGFAPASPGREPGILLLNDVDLVAGAGVEPARIGV